MQYLSSAGIKSIRKQLVVVHEGINALGTRRPVECKAPTMRYSKTGL